MQCFPLQTKKAGRVARPRRNSAVAPGAAKSPMTQAAERHKGERESMKLSFGHLSGCWVLVARDCGLVHMLRLHPRPRLTPT
jgi:hypothetical protein